MALEQYRLLQSMRLLKEFTISRLAKEAGVSINTAYSFIRRSPHLVEEKGRAEPVGRGKPATIYGVRSEHVDGMTRALHDLILSKGEEEDPAIEVPAPLLASEALLLRTPPDSPDRARVLARARKTVDSAARYAEHVAGGDPADRVRLEDTIAIVRFLCALHEAEVAMAGKRRHPTLHELSGTLPSNARTQLLRRVLDSPLSNLPSERPRESRSHAAKRRREVRLGEMPVEGEPQRRIGGERDRRLVARKSRGASDPSRVTFSFDRSSSRRMEVALPSDHEGATPADASLCPPLQEIERGYAKAVLVATRGNVDQAAKILKIGAKRLKILIGTVEGERGKTLS